MLFDFHSNSIMGYIDNKTETQRVHVGFARLHTAVRTTDPEARTLNDFNCEVEACGIFCGRDYVQCVVIR